MSRSRLFLVGATGLAVGLLLLSGLSPVVQAQEVVQARLIQSDTNRLVVEIDIAQYSVRERRLDGRLFSVLSIPGIGNSSEPGKPDLPVKGVMLGIPAGAQAQLRILQDDVRRD